MILLGYRVPATALGLAAGAAVGLVAVDAFGGRIAPPAWRRPVAVAPECIVRLSPNHGGSRSASSIRGVILHSTESASALSAVNWFLDPSSKVSAHIVTGEDACYRCVPDLVVAWAAGAANDRFLQLEVTGFARWTKAEWLARPGTLARTRAQIAWWCQEYGLPTEFLDAAALKTSAKGISTHWQATLAFSGGVGHTDPGKHFPLGDVGVTGYGPTPFAGLVAALHA